MNGYIQKLCANGHYSCSPNDKICHACKTEFVFFNSVDESNFNSYGIIPHRIFRKLQITEDVIEMCNLGHEHMVSEATYSIPSKQEAHSYRSFWDEDTQTYVAISSLVNS